MHENPIEYIVARTAAEVESIRQDWEQLQSSVEAPSLYTDIGRYLCMIRHAEETFEPYVIVFREKQKPVFMVVGRLEHRDLNLKIAYKTIARFSLPSLVIVHEGFVGQQTPQVCETLKTIFQDVLRSHDIKLVFVNHIKTNTALYGLLGKWPNIFSRDHFISQESHWIIRIPSTLEEYHASFTKKRKRRFRSARNRLQKMGDGHLEIQHFTSPEKLDIFIQTASEIAHKTYKDKLNVAFKDDTLTRALLHYYAEQGYLKAYLLFVGQKPCAFLYAIAYGKTLFPGSIGYDPAYSNGSPGAYMFEKSFEDAIEMTCIDVIDFGFGDADYKLFFCNDRSMESSIYLFAPSVKIIIINLLRSIIHIIDRLLIFIVKKLGFAQRVKKMWRNKIATKKSEKQEKSK